MKIAAVLPAYNEAARVLGVLRAVTRAPSIDEVLVVNDGSTDATAEVVRAVPGVCLVNLPVNRGKGGAISAGVAATDADILVFLDADLIGLKPEHVEALVAPVKRGRVQMAVGKFRGGRYLTDISQKLVPNVSGQRAIRRDVFEQIPDLAQARYGVEMAITRFCHHYRIPTEAVLIPGVTHPMKEEKLGFLRGAASRAKMYWEILMIVSDPRAPRRVRHRRIHARDLLRKMAANQRRHGHPRSASYWLYKQERGWRKRRQASKTK